MVVVWMVIPFGSVLGKGTLGILVPPELAVPADLLTASLSGNDEISVVERQELDRVVSEQKLQANALTPEGAIATGRLLNADAILIFEVGKSRVGQPATILRLVACGPGAILGQWEAPFPVPDVAEWVARIADETALRLQAFASPQADRFALSIAAVRSAVGNDLTSAKEDLLGALLARRLIRTPGMIVLERWKLDQLEWEKQLGEADPVPFAGGSAVVEVSVDFTSGYIAQAVLRKPGGEKTVSASAGDLAGLADALGAEIVREVEGRGTSASWDPKKEAEVFLEQARWAMRFNAYEQASVAAETCWALGIKTDEVGRLRLAAIVGSAARKGPMVVGRAREPAPSIWESEAALLAADRFRETRQVLFGDGSLPVAWITIGTDTLRVVSIGLQKLYYASDLDARRTELAGALRQAATHVSGDLTKSTLSTPDGWKRDQQVSIYDRDADDNEFWNVVLVRMIFSSLYGSSVAESLANLKTAWSDSYLLPMEVRNRMMVEALFQRQRNEPWVVAWNSAERPQIGKSMAAFFEWLDASGEFEREVDAASIQAWRFLHVRDLMKRGTYPVEAANRALSGLREKLVSRPDAIVEGSIGWRQVVGNVRMMEEIGDLAKNAKISGLDANTVSIRFAYLQAMLKAKKHFDGMETYNPLFYSESGTDEFTKPEFATLDSLISDFVRSDPVGGKFLKYKQNELAGRAKAAPEGDRRTVAVHVEPTPSTASADELLPRFVWNMPDKWESGMLEIPIYRNGRIWVLCKLLDHVFQVAAIDPGSGQAVSLPPLKAQAGAYSNWETKIFDIVGKHVFVAVNDGVAIFDLDGSTWRIVPIGDFVCIGLWRVGDSVVLAGRDGVIVRMRAPEFQPEILASSRRRPAVTVLDNQAPHTISRAFEFPDWMLCVVRGNTVYRFDEQRSDWDSIFVYGGNPSMDWKLIESLVGGDGCLTEFANPDIAQSLVYRATGTWSPQRLTGGSANRRVAFGGSKDWAIGRPWVARDRESLYVLTRGAQGGYAEIFEFRAGDTNGRLLTVPTPFSPGAISVGEGSIAISGREGKSIVVVGVPTVD